ncbi:TniQ family protein [Massilia sp. MB5]|uniref:TniQ family protein n=1 Tax=Massilia sp. MB5 TaxID=2919578 RepID=UPI001F0D6EE1|nr:TniQ family protein [Massilia sp. MB5]UMR31980.1 TniQ family protein [Massilia sp. MB5]
MLQFEDVGDCLEPRRSILYNLAPIKMGSHSQESLTSYLIRLARAHCVNPRDLIKRVFGEQDAAIAQLADNTFYTRYALTVNGLGQHAKLMARVSNELTSRSDLQALTMLPWAGIIPEQSEGFIARHPRWCPLCFHDQLIESGETYTPLVWALVPYRRCTVHHCALEEVCPSCGKTQAFISRIADASICGHCQTSLARSGQAGAYHGSGMGAEQADGYEDILEAMVGQQLCTQGLITRELVCSSLISIVAGQFEGSRIRLCRAMGWNQWAINGWLDKGERISLPKLLQLARGFNISVVDLCKGIVNLEQLSTQSAVKPVVSRSPRPKLTQQQRSQCLQELNSKLSQGIPPTSMREAGMPYGLGRSAMRYWFPDLCERISTRRAQDRRQIAEGAARDRARIVTEAVDALIRAGLHPTRRKVDQAIRKHGLALARPEVFQEYVQAARGAKRSRNEEQSEGNKEIAKRELCAIMAPE